MAPGHASAPDRAEVERTVAEFRAAFGRLASWHEQRGSVLPGEATASTHCTLRGAVRQAGSTMFGARWSDDAFAAMKWFPATAEHVDQSTRQAKANARWTDEDDDDEDLHDPIGECRLALGSVRGAGEHWDRAMVAARFVVEALGRGLAHEIVPVASNQGANANQPTPTPSPDLWRPPADPAVARIAGDRLYFSPGFTRAWFGRESASRAPWMPLVSRADLDHRLALAGHRARQSPVNAGEADVVGNRAATRLADGDAMGPTRRMWIRDWLAEHGEPWTAPADGWLAGPWIHGLEALAGWSLIVQRKDESGAWETVRDLFTTTRRRTDDGRTVHVAVLDDFGDVRSGEIVAVQEHDSPSPGFEARGKVRDHQIRIDGAAHTYRVFVGRRPALRIDPEWLKRPVFADLVRRLRDGTLRARAVGLVEGIDGVRRPHGEVQDLTPAVWGGDKRKGTIVFGDDLDAWLDFGQDSEERRLS